VFFEAVEDECATRLVATLPGELLEAMTKTSSSGGSNGLRSTGRRGRARLATALKANLRRRKAQARERAAETGHPEQDPEGPAPTIPPELSLTSDRP